MATTFKACAVPGCNEPHKSKGYCASHAERVRRHGCPMADKPLVKTGAPAAFLRSIAGHTGDECVRWPFATNSAGYPQIGKGGKVVYAHRELCRLVHGEPPTPRHEVAHSCGKGHEACVNPKHLRWATRSENMMDKASHGTSNRGPAHPLSILTIGNVREIRAMRGKVSQREIAARFGVHEVTVHYAQVGKSWAWLDADADPSD